MGTNFVSEYKVSVYFRHFDFVTHKSRKSLSSKRAIVLKTQFYALHPAKIHNKRMHMSKDQGDCHHSQSKETEIVHQLKNNAISC